MKTIVILDDHQSVAESIPYVLKSEFSEYNCVAISSVAEARQKLVAMDPVVVIVDWRLGNNQTGRSVMEELGSKIPNAAWILFTGNPLSQVLSPDSSSPFGGYVSKASALKELTLAVKSALNGDQYFCPIMQKHLVRMLAAKKADLSDVECQILRCIAEGKEPKEIAEELGLAVKTIHNYIAFLRKKTGAESMVALANYAVEHGIAQPPSVT